MGAPAFHGVEKEACQPGVLEPCRSAPNLGVKCSDGTKGNMSVMRRTEIIALLVTGDIIVGKPLEVRQCERTEENEEGTCLGLLALGTAKTPSELRG